MDDLRAWDIPFAAVPESADTQDILRKNRLVFIDSALEHDDVVAKNEQLRALLTAGSLPRRYIRSGPASSGPRRDRASSTAP